MELNLGARSVFAHDGGVPFDPSRPAVVLIHGAGQDHSLYRYLTRLLAHRGFAAMAVDLPGHGRSAGPPLATIEDMAGWVLALAGELDVSRTAVVGHSMGALVAVECAAAVPDRVSTLVLTGPSAQMAVHPDLQGAADAGDPLAIRLILGWSHTGTSRFGAHPDPGIWTRGLAARLLEEGAGSLGSDLRACSRYSAVDRASQVECPVTVVVGTRDRMTPPTAGEEIAAAFRQGEVVRVEGAGHHLPGDRPLELAQAVVSRLERTA